MAVRPHALVALFVLAGSVGTAFAQADAAKAADDCESAVTDAVKRMRGRGAQDVQFNKTRRTITPSSDDETTLKGEGRYRGTGGRNMPFSYSCALNTKTGATSGVVFRELATVLDAESRQLKPAADEHIALEGRGAVERAPGMNAVPFTYRCEVEPRSGRIVSVQTAL
jgi:hypothetical protein